MNLCSPPRRTGLRAPCSPPHAAQTNGSSSSAATGRSNGTVLDAPVQIPFTLRAPELRTPLTSRAIARAMDKTIEEVRSTCSPIATERESTARCVHRICHSCDNTFMQISRSSHRGKVAYQGCPGAYSEKAATTACPEFEPLPCAQFDVAFQALSQWMADRACLPIENSLGGVYSALRRHLALLLRSMQASGQNS